MNDDELLMLSILNKPAKACNVDMLISCQP